ncbi:sensor histidine kinase [Algoriphagus yeomjeoni]|uniref:histidine kinase n=1 Tax=Algoriphagus yeomjeoni TaxID=291403 RepID=A0A327PR68_9BACT|nr:HAMP domain-containing sensor histidine kinase [Algoriphagus yeomjeoni]RAI94855.1 phospho-acceptor domain-containing protein [Algoriphagus yeomjeoni]
MNQQLQTILDIVQLNESFADEEKAVLITAIKKVDSDLSITEFKLERTEKVKRTTAILLEETIEELEQKRKAIEETNSALENSLKELKAAQAQLIQSEKMASLGELTAGIAHEIQNPLNFVNNFSEVSDELIDEMNEELEKGDLEEVRFIAADLKENLSKINHHGKRADAIVKGMLEHSKSGTGTKESTNLNKLVKEFTQLAYSSQQAKNKDFKVDLTFILDPNIPSLEVIPSDIGKVMLNLVNNAFYACAERSRSAVNEKSKQEGEEYKPEVFISSKKSENGIEISVQDNGSGIPDSIKDKIFQPFFTTKPTGSGTGLGLSLSYDIVKAHGGKFRVESIAGEGSTFFMQLPLQ